MTTTTFQTETLDESLSLEELSAINGAGGVWDWIKDKAEDVGDFIEETFGDGDGTHEWKDDYRDEAIKVGVWILGAIGKKD
tara:strand:+ start:2953 stop:3195 length:243 start_codon:yes stop_codon:yes gene_type:complete